MSSIALLFMISTLFSVHIRAEELFCAKDRGLLLGGVFNYDKVLFAYSWKEVNSAQLWLVWRFELKSDKVVAIGRDTNVDQVFPGIPLFRAGFGLTIKCDKSDEKCKSYRKLVFVFFMTTYKVFRLANDVLFAETNKSRVPWGLSTEGENIDWSFGTPIGNINSIMFASGQIYLISQNSLFVSPADINAKQLKWQSIAKNQDFTQSLGGFVVGDQLLINKNEAPESVLLRYDLKGKELEKINVWKYFRCDDGSNEEVGAANGDDGKSSGQKENTLQQRNKSLITTIVISLVGAIVLTNLIAGVFWLSVLFKHKQQNKG